MNYSRLPHIELSWLGLRRDDFFHRHTAKDIVAVRDWIYRDTIDLGYTEKIAALTQRLDYD